MGFNVTALAQKARTKTIIVDSDLDMGQYDVIATDVKGDTAEFSEFVGGVGNFEKLEFQAGEPSGYNPIGSIIAFGSANVPANWLSCNGSAVSRETYAELFSVIGTSFGSGDGNTTFNLPNLNNRVLRGSNTIGITGGSDSVTLNTANLPSHTHGVGTLSLSTTGAHTHNVASGGTGSSPPSVYNADTKGVTGRAWAGVVTDSNGNHSHTISGSTSSVGSGSAVSITNPYVGINYIIRAL